MRLLWIVLAGAVPLWACHKSPSDHGRSQGGESARKVQTDKDLDAPVAEIDGRAITVREFQERLNRKGPYVRARYKSREKKREFLQDMVRFEVLAKEAKARGFDKSPDVVLAVKKMMVQKLLTDEFKSRVKPEDISDEEMQAFYDEHQNEYHKPEEVRIAAIILKDRARAEEAAKKAHGEAGSTNRGFRDLVEKYSVDQESKKRGGDLRYFNRDATGIPAPVVEAAFGLSRGGEVAGPVDAGDGTFYVIKKTGDRPEVSRSFEDVKRRIRNRLYQEKRSQAQMDFISELKKKAKIEIHEENLEKVQIAPAPPGAQRRHGGPHGAHNTPELHRSFPVAPQRDEQP